MKTTLLILLLLSPQINQAQGTIYLSNLGQPSTGSNPVGMDSAGDGYNFSWIAAGFSTGTNAGGYTLNSIQLEMTNAVGNPDDFAAMIYSASNGIPGNSLGTLNGSTNPSTAGIYTYTPTSDMALSSNTVYFIVAIAGAAVSGAYEWSYAGTNSYNPSDGWVGPQTGFSRTHVFQSNGSQWTLIQNAPQFAIDATAVPEPSSGMLLIFGGIFLFGISFRHCSPQARHHRKF